MIRSDSTRRAFLKTSGAALGGSWIALSLPMILTSCREASQVRRDGAAFRVLSADEAQEFEAMAARIVPTDDTPGATEAGVIHFLDRVLGGHAADVLEPLRQGLSELQVAAGGEYGGRLFSALSPSEQDGLLRGIETTEFFGTVRYLTLAGMFSLPEYGGNQDRVGWQLLGFEDRHAWQPPFGFYDADYAEKGE